MSNVIDFAGKECCGCRRTCDLNQLDIETLSRKETFFLSNRQRNFLYRERRNADANGFSLRQSQVSEAGQQNKAEAKRIYCNELFWFF